MPLTNEVVKYHCADIQFPYLFRFLNSSQMRYDNRTPIATQIT